MQRRGRAVPWLVLVGFVLVVGGLNVAPTESKVGREILSLGGMLPAEPPPFVVEAAVVIEKREERREPRVDEARGEPVRLVVPSLGVDAPVVGIGVVGGVLLPPDDPTTLGWWSSGAEPGAAKGSALITGHTVHTGGGAFDDLGTLRAGDRVRVRTLKGVIRYHVTDVTTYRKARLAEHAKSVFSQSVNGRLVLITCEDWNGTGYDSNSVVIAKRSPT
jgi:LPXTG-site transpeptidase (sortase) family protein